MLVFEPVNPIIIAWLGPYKIKDLEEEDTPNVLYLIAGKKKYGKKMKILYIGLTSRTAYQRIREHRRSSEKSEIRWEKTAEIWVGHIQHPNPCDSKSLGVAEHYLIHYAAPLLNGKKQSRPKQIACIVSQWRKPDRTPYQQKQAIHQGLPDVIWWDKHHWRCGNLSIFK